MSDVLRENDCEGPIILKTAFTSPPAFSTRLADVRLVELVASFFMLTSRPGNATPHCDAFDVMSFLMEVTSVFLAVASVTANPLDKTCTQSLKSMCLRS